MVRSRTCTAAIDLAVREPARSPPPRLISLHAGKTLKQIDTLHAKFKGLTIRESSPLAAFYYKCKNIRAGLRAGRANITGNNFP